MDSRSHESPMDFEYQNGTGPMDLRSPFAQVSMNQQRTNGVANSPRKRSGTSKLSNFGLLMNIPTDSTTGFLGAFQSPSKSSFASSTSSSQAPTPFSAVKPAPFATPRKLDLDNASSGGETPQSVDHTMIDSDATPDNGPNFRRSPVKFDQPMPTFTAGGPSDSLPSPSKRPARRESWWSRGWDYISSPGRSRAEHNDKSLRRIRKKRADRSHRQLARLRDHDDDDGSQSPSDSDHDDVVVSRRAMSPRKTSRSNRNTTALGLANDPNALAKSGYTSQISSFFEFLAKHPTLPAILSWYAQLTLNIFLFTGIMFVLWSFWSTIRSDVDKKSSEAVAELLAEMAVCANSFTENRCARDTRVPAMETVCSNWEKCMKRDVTSVGRARVSAHTFAEIFNSFLEPISYKAMVFSLILVFGCVALSNLPFSMFRDKAAAAAADAAHGGQAQNHHHYYPPPTPSRQISGSMEGMQSWVPAGILEHGGHGGQYGQHGMQHGPQETIDLTGGGGIAGGNRFGHIDGRGSPVKTLQFR